MIRVGIVDAPDGGGWDDWASDLPSGLELCRLPQDGDWPGDLDRIVFEASPFDPDRTALSVADRRRGMAGPRSLCVALPCRPAQRAERRARAATFGDLLAGAPGPLAVLDIGALQDRHIAAGGALDAMLLTEAGRPTPPLALVIGRLVGEWVATGDFAGPAAIAELALWHAAYARRWTLALPDDLRVLAGEVRTAALTAERLPDFLAVAGGMFAKLGHPTAAALFAPKP